MIDPERFGVSFSLKQCRNFGLDPRETLDWLIAQGFRRFRLMSYWDIHEAKQGKYDFSELDWQLQLITKAGGEVSLCLGVKQPRWPEYHWPDWAWQVEKSMRDSALLAYIQAVVNRYKGNAVIVSWQLENEALLQGFGERIEIDRPRLHAEYTLVKQLDPSRPIIMSTSNGWGIPLRNSIPDAVGFSYYPIMYKNGRYHKTIQKPWLHRLRAGLIKLIWHKPAFIHELQCEPWGPQAIWEMSASQQAESMNPTQISRNVQLAYQTRLEPIDLWGAEWWYWCWLQGDTTVFEAVSRSLS